MFTPESLPQIIGLIALAVLILYAVLAGADFGGGIWDLLARGPRAGQHRAVIAAAMGPVWEANHVWLIFLIVILFTAFPLAFAALSVALFWPFHLVLLGIVLRGAAFVFRSYDDSAGRTRIDWGTIFGAASVFTPLLLGACLGAVSDGRIRVVGGGVEPGSAFAWLDAFPLATGALALAVCAYLAATYLTLETTGKVREDFRRRALGVWLVGGILSLGTLALAYTEAPRLWATLTGPQAFPVVALGVLLAPASAAAMWRRLYHLARALAIGQVILLLVGWALAQRPYLIYPDITIAGAAAPTATLSLVLWTLPFGMALLLPSLWLLFTVFKGRPDPAETGPTQNGSVGKVAFERSSVRSGSN